MTYQNIAELTEEDYQKAKIEVAFLLDAFASTIDNIMGGNTAPVGRIAGRDTAAKLPIEFQGTTIDEVMEKLGEQMKAGFSFAVSGEQIDFSTCIIRDICAARKIETGGPLCQLFHSYFDGIVNGLYSRPVKSAITETGATCRLKFMTQ